jgi:transposase-like protein
MDRGVRLVIGSDRPVAAIARDLGVGHEALRKRVRRAEADNGTRPDLPTTERATGGRSARAIEHERLLAVSQRICSHFHRKLRRSIEQTCVNAQVVG